MTHDSHVLDWQIWRESVRLSGSRPDHREPHIRVLPPENPIDQVSRKRPSGRVINQTTAKPWEGSLDGRPFTFTGPDNPRSRFTHEITMNAPVLPPRPRRPVTVYMNDATLDKLDALVAVLPDVPNRSRLIENFVELQIALLLDPAMALGPFIEGILDNVTREALAEISEWRVPETTETA